jgi:hypothetical protein
MDGDRAKPNVISRSGAKIQASTDRRIGVSSDEIVDNALHRSLFSGAPPNLFAISAVRFTDGAGDHEAHACFELRGINVQGLNWRECQGYVTTVDIPKRSFSPMP